MVNLSKQVFQKLSQYGINASQLSERQLHEKIIQMYDNLQQATTQNLLLKKQNDDLSLQIKTIDEIFLDANNSLASCLSSETYPHLLNQVSYENRQLKSNVLQNSLNSSKSKPNINFLVQNQNTHQKKSSPKQNFQQYINSQIQSTQTCQKTPRCVSKLHRNSRFCSDHKIFDKQQTSRMILGDKIDSQVQNSLNEKIQVLMKQNEIIMKRMNQLEVNFVKKGQLEEENFQYHKNFDDRLTNFSSNAPSIQNIRENKYGKTLSRGLSSNHRINYSTSNLRSYSPSIQ